MFVSLVECLHDSNQIIHSIFIKRIFQKLLCMCFLFDNGISDLIESNIDHVQYKLISQSSAHSIHMHISSAYTIRVSWDILKNVKSIIKIYCTTMVIVRVRFGERNTRREREEDRYCRLQWRWYGIRCHTLNVNVIFQAKLRTFHGVIIGCCIMSAYNNVMYCFNHFRGRWAMKDLVDCVSGRQ